MFDLSSKVAKLDHHIKFNVGAQLDLAWLHDFLEGFSTGGTGWEPFGIPTLRQDSHCDGSGNMGETPRRTSDAIWDPMEMRFALWLL